MPYAIVKQGKKYVVRKKLPSGSYGRTFGRHDTREEAEAQITALRIHVKEKK